LAGAAFFAAGFAAGLAAAFFAGAAAGVFLAVAIFEPPKTITGKVALLTHGLILVAFYCSCKSFSKFFHSCKPRNASYRTLATRQMKKPASRM
jgi:hypothetical protein